MPSSRRKIKLLQRTFGGTRCRPALALASAPVQRHSAINVDERSTVVPAIPVSVVVPCRNEAASTAGVLDGLRRQDYALHEVIVVDNASTDGTTEVVERYWREHDGWPLRTVRCDRVGQPAAMNAGIRAATGDVIVRMDAHARPDPAYVRLCVDNIADEGVRAGVVGGAWRILPGSQTTVALAIARAVAHPMGAGDAAYRTGGAVSGPRPVDTVPFGCFRRTLWEELGGFNEHILSNEDYEFNYRVRRTGRQVVLDPRIRSTYYARATLGALAAQYFRYGWWKAQMLKVCPASLRWRQAVPVAFVGTAGLLLLSWAALATAGWPAATRAAGLGLAALLAVYAAALLGASWRIAGGLRSWAALAVLPAAFATIHCCWGSGVLVNLLTGGRWPRVFRRLARAT